MPERHKVGWAMRWLLLAATPSAAVLHALSRSLAVLLQHGARPFEDRARFGKALTCIDDDEGALTLLLLFDIDERSVKKVTDSLQCEDVIRECRKEGASQAC